MTRTAGRVLVADDYEPNLQGLRQLLEEREVCRGERLQRRELDDRLSFPFEEHRQHDDVLGKGAAQTGVHARVLPRHLGEQNALLLERAPSWLVSYLAKKRARRALSVYRSNTSDPSTPADEALQRFVSLTEELAQP